MEYDLDVLNEQVSKSKQEELKRYGFTVFDKHEAGRSDIVYFSSLEGLSGDTFINKFMRYCKDMQENYNANILYIPLDSYYILSDKDFEKLISNNGNMIGNLYNFIANKTDKFNSLTNFYIIFVYENHWFAINSSEYTKKDNPVFKSNLRMIFSEGAKIRNATGTTNKKSNNVKEFKSKEEIDKDRADNAKDELLDKIDKAVEATGDENQSIDLLDDDKRVAQILYDLDSSDYGRPKFSNTRTNRVMKLNNNYKTSTINGKSVKELLENPNSEQELPESDLKLNSPNEEWGSVKFINFNKEYDIDEDIAAILQCFVEKKYPVAVRKVTVEDTSTSLDYLYTYRSEMEDINGKRFTLAFDMPKLINDRFMMLRGNQKVISGQLINLPCTKTDEDTVQLVSNYNKIFIYRYGTVGKAHPASDILLKSLSKYDGKTIKVVTGDYSKTCAKYDLPVDYIDLASSFNYIEIDDLILYFDQDIYHTQFSADRSKGLPIGVYKSNNGILYYARDNGEVDYNQQTVSHYIANILCGVDREFSEIYTTQKPASKHMYSRARVMSGYIPLIVVICNQISFTDFMRRAKIEYRFEEKKVRINSTYEGIIKLADGYIVYALDYISSMLMNGLMDCDVEMYTFDDLNKKKTWIDMLDNFGGRILADGLENFNELFVDPITKEVCMDCGLPTDYIDLLLYANSLLADNKYIKHTDITGNRYRTTEVIAGHLYKALAKSYEEYLRLIKAGRKSPAMSIKKSAVIDEIMKNPVTSDLSIMSPLLEIEANYSATFKGLSGLNADRAYSLDKRTYDPSMVNKLALSTGFAENVGINRQTTMDMEVQGKRGYIKNSDPEDISLTKRLSVTEAVTPFGTTHDDPIRSAMAYIQTAKHSMPTDKSAPLLVTNGADEAMPYMASETFAWRAKESGTVKELIPNEYMIAEYKSGISDYISLKEEVKKNSDGGFYITIKLDTDYKKGQKFSEGDVLAYDRKSFSNKIGEADGLAYNLGVLAKIAILASDEGFEDSAVISEWLSEAMATSVVTQIPISISANANIYHIAKVGEPIEEGEPLIIMQDSVSEKDAAALLHNITDNDLVSDLGKIKIKSKYTGIVQDIKMYRTCDIDDFSPSLTKVVKDYEKEIKNKKKIYKDNNVPGESTIDPDYAMTPTGKLKNIGDGVLIEFYVKYYDTMGVGDKLTFQAANKGVVKSIIKAGDEPYTKFRPDQPIHALASSRSFNARMVTSPIVSGAINKGLIELDRQVKEIMGLEQRPIEDMQ